MPSSPSSDQKASFFTKLQHLLTAGEFVSTYKYALLLSITRWAVENPGRDESEPVDVIEFAPHFLDLYWPHAHPFEGGVETWVAGVADSPRGWSPTLDSLLVQDRGNQMPRILRLIQAEHAQGYVRPRELPEDRRRNLLAEVKRTLRDQPLWKLHTIQGSRGFRFLYHPIDGSRGHVMFEPGIIGCLASFAPLIEHMVRSAWLQFVLRCNRRFLARASELEAFLFPQGRNDLAVWRGVLLEATDRRCFYCDEVPGQRLDVDHFLPWSWYPHDLGHNFVLAHPHCNNRKKDRLASAEHLARWCERNTVHGAALRQAFDGAHLPHDLATSYRVATSLYSIAEAAEAPVWQGGTTLVPLDEGWRRMIPA